MTQFTTLVVTALVVLLSGMPSVAQPTSAQRCTYRAATDGTVDVAASATAPFFVLYGSSTKIVRVESVRVTGPTTTTLAIQGYTLRKYSTRPSGGTATTLTATPVDSRCPAATVSLARVYTAAPTAGTTVGVLMSSRALNKSTTAVDGAEMGETVFAVGGALEHTPVVLRGTAEGIGVQLHVSTATTATVDVVWTEEPGL